MIQDRKTMSMLWDAACHVAMLEERVFSWISQRPVWDTRAPRQTVGPPCVSCRKDTLLYGCFCDTEANRTHPFGPDADVMRGWDATSLARDPDGLDDVDPFVLGLLASRSSKPMMVLATAAYHLGPDHWAKQMWDSVSESPPCALISTKDLVDGYEREMAKIGRQMLGIDVSDDRRMTVVDMRVDAEGRTHVESYECVMEASPLEVQREMQKRMMEPPPYDAIIGDQVIDFKTGPLTVDDLRPFDRIFVTTPPEPGVRYGPYDADPHTRGRRKRFRKQRRS